MAVKVAVSSDRREYMKGVHNYGYPATSVSIVCRKPLRSREVHERQSTLTNTALSGGFVNIFRSLLVVPSVNSKPRFAATENQCITTIVDHARGTIKR
jgi:hypothetical protein